MIGGFRKNSKRANIRKKIISTGGSDDEDGEIQNAESENNSPVPEVDINPQPEPVAPPPVKTKKDKTKKTALSFGDELEKEDEFVLKRSKASLSLNEQVKREKKHKKKREIQAANQTYQGLKEDIKSTVVVDEPEIVLKQSQIPFSVNGRNANSMIINDVVHIKDDIKDDDDDTGTDSNAAHHFSIRNKQYNPGDIPDAATIYAMKKKREQARQFGGQVNYIPLDSNKHESRFKAGKSRLIREEMDDSSDEDRMEMKGSHIVSHPALERRKQVAKALEEVEDNEDNDVLKEDDEIQRWEDEKMKTGSTIPTNQPDTKRYGPKLPDKNMVPSFSMNMNSFNTAMGLPTTSYDYTSTITSYAPQIYTSNYSTPTPEQKVVTVDLVEKRLSEQLDTKIQLHRIHKQECEKTKFDLDSSKDNIVDLERKAADVSDRFTFYQDIRGYIKDLLECLQEKVKKIYELEESMHQILKKRSEKLVMRRQNDVKDEVEQVSGKNTSESDRIANIKNRRIAEREGRRTRRRESRKKENILNHYDGMSSDDEMIPSEVLRFDADKAKILKESESIFEDVVEEFTEIQQIVSRFEQWKFAFNESYKNAFLGLCLPKLFKPFIKQQLLNWNPLEIENVDFEDMHWCTSLVMYGHHGGEVDTEDDDLNLLPNIIEKVLIPKLTVLIKDVWDPLSSKETKLVTFLFQRIVDDYPTLTKDSKTTKFLVESIVSRISHSVESEIYIPLYSRELLEGKNPHALTFLERQFWKGVKLLQNLMEWNWLLSQKNLLQLGIDAILNRYLIIALQQFPDPSSTLEKAKTIISILPKEWFEKSDEIVAGMESFSRCLSGLARNIYTSGLGYTDVVEQKKMKITIKKIISLLMHIQAFDEARNVANSYASRKDKDSPALSPVC